VGAGAGPGGLQGHCYPRARTVRASAWKILMHEMINALLHSFVVVIFSRNRRLPLAHSFCSNLLRCHFWHTSSHHHHSRSPSLTSYRLLPRALPCRPESNAKMGRAYSLRHALSIMWPDCFSLTQRLQEEKAAYWHHQHSTALLAENVTSRTLGRYAPAQ
jgi:hypothetical protein